MGADLWVDGLNEEEATRALATMGLDPNLRHCHQIAHWKYGFMEVTGFDVGDIQYHDPVPPETVREWVRCAKDREMSDDGKQVLRWLSVCVDHEAGVLCC